MRSLKELALEIFREQKDILVMMLLNFVFSLALFIYSLVTLNPSSAVTKIGYGDIGGYRDGAWGDMLSFSILAILFGILHNILSLRIYEKRGASMTKVFLAITISLIVGAFIVLSRLLGEG